MNNVAIGHAEEPERAAHLSLATAEIKCCVMRLPHIRFYLIPSPCRNKGELLLVATFDERMAYFHESCYIARSHFPKLTRTASLLPNPPEEIRLRAVQLAKEFIQ